MMASGPRHDAKFSAPIVELLGHLLNDESSPVAGLIVDPFAGVGLLEECGRTDIAGIEIEPEWAATRPWIVCGSALDRDAYPSGVGALVTSPCYGNRMAGNYLGKPCSRCAEDPGGIAPDCPTCDGSGRNRSGRYGYAISLGRKVSPGSAAALEWGPGYRSFHAQWLKLIGSILELGPNRLLLNMSDHYRGKSRRYVVAWWIAAARHYGLELAAAHAVSTSRIGHGQNRDARAVAEQVLVFDVVAPAKVRGTGKKRITI